jgi:hypothetical protein
MMSVRAPRQVHASQAAVQREGSLPINPEPHPDPPAPEPIRSVHAPNFPGLLRELGISLLVTTYQAGKLVVLRAEEDHINTHFRKFPNPMGLAVGGNRLALGTLLEIWEFHEVPAVIPKLEPAGRVDACYLPREAASGTRDQPENNRRSFGVERPPSLSNLS